MKNMNFEQIAIERRKAMQRTNSVIQQEFISHSEVNRPWRHSKSQTVHCNGREYPLSMVKHLGMESRVFVHR